MARNDLVGHSARSATSTETDHNREPTPIARGTHDTRKYLVSFPFHNFLLLGRLPISPAGHRKVILGKKSASYLSNALPERTSRHKFVQMYGQGSRTAQTACPTHPERSLQVWAPREELGVTARCR